MRVAASVLRNVLGLVCILAGLAMLVLPGQGLLTLLVGLLLVECPHKYRVEKWVVSRRRVLGAIHRFRRRRGKAALVVSRSGEWGAVKAG